MKSWIENSIGRRDIEGRESDVNAASSGRFRHNGRKIEDGPYQMHSKSSPSPQAGSPELENK